jgi:cell division protein FtsW
MPVKRSPDWLIVVCAVTLFTFGLVMIYSSSAVMAADRFGDPFFFLKRQALWGVLGLAGMAVAMRIEYHALSRYAYVIYVGALVALALVFLPGVGHKVNGAQRWIDLGVGAVQPAEFVKLALILFFAATLAKKAEEKTVKDFTFGFVPCLLALLIALAMIQMQPDMGTALVIGTVSFFLFWVGGVRSAYLAGTAFMAAPVVYLSIYNVGYRRKRILSFLDPWQDVSDTGYQIIQSYIALARGGIFGAGLGESQQKLFYLPEAHTDFIFAIVGEELGMVGVLFLLAVFVTLAWRGYRAGAAAPDRFGMLLAYGITFAFSLQALVNLSVAMGLAPTKGLPLPFVSLGGSALVMWMIAVGLLANVSESAMAVEGTRRQRRQQPEGSRNRRLLVPQA